MSEHQHSESSEFVSLSLALLALVAGYCVAVSSERIVLAGIHSVHPDAWFGEGSHSEVYVLALVAILLAITAFCWAQAILRRIGIGLDPQQPATFLRIVQTALAVRLDPRNYRNQTLQLGVAFLWVAVPVHWLASLVAGFLSNVSVHPPPTQADYWIVPAGTAICAAYTAWIRQRTPIPLVKNKEEPGPYSGLILFLSNPLSPRSTMPGLSTSTTANGQGVRVFVSWSDFQEHLRKTTINATEPLQPHKAYEDDIVPKMKEKFGSHNWMMPFLAILHQANKGRLRHVIVIPSEKLPTDTRDVLTERSGTALMVPLFTEWIRAQLNQPALRIEAVPPDGVSFYDPEKLAGAIEAAYSRLRKNEDVTDVIVDLTSGTKECSLAAALQSMSIGRMVMYTDNNSYIPRQYDISIPEHLAAALHGG